MLEDAEDRSAAELDESEEIEGQSYNAAGLDEFEEARRTCKALYYEDICV